MAVTIQFPSPALWHQVLSGPPVSRDQGTRNPIGGFNEMVHAQMVKQTAIAGLQPPPPRQPLIQRPPEKDARERNRNSPEQREGEHDARQGGHPRGQREHSPAQPRAGAETLVRAMLA